MFREDSITDFNPSEIRGPNIMDDFADLCSVFLLNDEVHPFMTIEFMFQNLRFKLVPRSLNWVTLVISGKPHVIEPLQKQRDVFSLCHPKVDVFAFKQR